MNNEICSVAIESPWADSRCHCEFDAMTYSTRPQLTRFPPSQASRVSRAFRDFREQIYRGMATAACNKLVHELVSISAPTGPVQSACSIGMSKAALRAVPIPRLLAFSALADICPFPLCYQRLAADSPFGDRYCAHTLEMTNRTLITVTAFAERVHNDAGSKAEFRMEFEAEFSRSNGPQLQASSRREVKDQKCALRQEFVVRSVCRTEALG